MELEYKFLYPRVCGKMGSRDTPFDNLSWECLLFLEQSTRNKEPWMGYGFATEVHSKITEALIRKAERLDKKLKTTFYSEMLVELSVTAK